MKPLHLKKKYMYMLNTFSVENAKKRNRLKLKAKIKDEEGKFIEVLFGEVDHVERIGHLGNASLDFVTAFLYQTYKKEQHAIEGFDDAIKSLLARWDNMTLTLVLQHGEHEESSYIDILDTKGKTQRIDVHYKDFSSIWVRSYNSFVVLLEQLKENDVLLPTEEEMEEHFIQYLSLSHLTFDIEDFLYHYKHMLKLYVKWEEIFSEHFVEHDTSRYISFGYSEEEIQEKERLRKENMKALRKRIENEYSVTEKLLRQYYQK